MVRIQIDGGGEVLSIYHLKNPVTKRRGQTEKKRKKKKRRKGARYAKARNGPRNRQKLFVRKKNYCPKRKKTLITFSEGEKKKKPFTMEVKNIWGSGAPGQQSARGKAPAMEGGRERRGGPEKREGQGGFLEVPLNINEEAGHKGQGLKVQLQGR